MKTITSSPPYRPFQRRFWTAYVIHMRPLSAFYFRNGRLSGNGFKCRQLFLYHEHGVGLWGFFPFVWIWSGFY
jgi:hypothetical protein